MKKMTRLDIIKEQFKHLNLSIIDILKIVDPSDKNTYLEFLTKNVEKKISDRTRYNRQEWIHELTYNDYFPKEKIESLSDYQINLFFSLLSNVIDREDIKTLNEYHQLKLKNRLTSTDLTKLKSFDDMAKIVSISNLAHVDKDLEKLIIKLHEDDEWLVIKPLTHFASQKYGSNTKWCTTSSSPEHFRRYAIKGIITYFLNKKTGGKVASFFSLDKEDKEFSFWNMIDNRIDSLQSGLPKFILDIMLNDSRTCEHSNFDLLSTDQKILEISYYNNYGIKEVSIPMVDRHRVEEEIDWGALEESELPNESGVPRMTVVGHAENQSIIVRTDGQTYSVTNDGIDFANNETTTW